MKHRDDLIHFAASWSEIYWKTFLTYARVDPKTAYEKKELFENRIASLASKLDAESASFFLGEVEKNREKLFQEFKSDPNKQKRRLGVPVVCLKRNPPYNQGLGQVIVRTAVRATIWDLIWNLFR